MIAIIKNQFAKLAKHIPSYPNPDGRLELALIATLLLLVIVAPSLWYIKILVTILGIFGIVFKPWREKSLFWLALFTLLIFECYYLWHSQDNHKYLISYWCLAVGLAYSSSNAQKFLFNNARILIGLCFLLAVIAKLVSISYMDSTFFRETLMSDTRFRPVAVNVVGIDKEVFQQNAQTLSQLVNDQGPTKEVVEVNHPRKLTLAAWMMTVWTLIIEVLIAIAFLWKPTGWVSSCRNYLLCCFVLSTYAVANVIGFGWILAILGIAQLKDNEKHFAIVYFLLIVVLHVYRAPWSMLATTVQS